MRRLLPAGDLVMMRRQLLNLKALAEATATEAVGSSLPIEERQEGGCVEVVHDRPHHLSVMKVVDAHHG